MFDGLSWIMPERVLLARYSGILSLADIEASAKDIAQVIAANLNPIHVILDMGLRQGVDRSAINIREFTLRLAPLLTQEIKNELRWVIIVNPGADRSLTMIWDIITQLHQIRARTLMNVDEAIQFLKDVDDYLIELC